MIPGSQRKTNLTAHRGNIDDCARALLTHLWEQELGEPGQTEQVHFELVTGIIDRGVLYRTVAAKTGVIDQYINFTNLSEDRLYHAANILLAGNIHCQALCSRLFELGHVLQATDSTVNDIAVG